ncbi:MAG: Bifunctional NAD(P)H-hydrate repair enzyme Nnr [Fimbriimonadaceae bacterium]|nr:Bifunctional NAD(P)H-hydrate repair enzyme Nnr [Fimbriimonadaceae bacterium]
MKRYNDGYPYGQILTSVEIKELDRSAVESAGMAEGRLMQQAGEAVFRHIRETHSDAKRFVVAVGKGNNGGDGIVVAHLLAQSGSSVRCLIASPKESFAFPTEGLQAVFVDDPSWSAELALIEADLVVDAVLGIGAKGAPTGAVAELIEAVNRFSGTVLSIDIPSGIDADSGLAPGVAVWAEQTVVIGFAKPYLFLNAGMIRAGDWHVAPLDYPAELTSFPPVAGITAGAWVKQVLPDRQLQSHKGENGRVLIVAGSPDMPGAAVLAAKGAIRAGAGLVTVCSHPSVCQIVAGHLPEAIVWPILNQPDASREIRDRISAFDAAVFGPGMGQTEHVRRTLADIWSHGGGLPVVIDADALNAVAAGVDLPQFAVITPHPGELSRLLGVSVGEIQSDRFGSVRLAAEKYQSIVLLKGAYTIVAERSHPLAVNPTGNPGMATGGMGDVLSGVIGTLVAQKVGLREAATCGAFWHGLAGDLCARHIGEVGYTASELADSLPAAREVIKAGST